MTDEVKPSAHEESLLARAESYLLLAKRLHPAKQWEAAILLSICILQDRRPTNTGMTVGERIRTRRQELGLSQTALAKKMGVSRAAINLWETGQTKQIRTETVLLLANVLGLPASVLQ